MNKITYTAAVFTLLATTTLTANSSFAALPVVNQTQDAEGAIVKAYKLYGGTIVELDDKELAEFKEKSKSYQAGKADPLKKWGGTIPSSGALLSKNDSSESVVSPEAWTDHRYKEYGFSAAQPIFNETTRATEYMDNWSSVAYKQTFKTTVSSTYTWSGTLSYGSKSALTSTFGSSWSNTYTTEVTRDVTVNPKKRVWLEWTPIKDNSWGLVTHTTYSDITGLPQDTWTEYIDVYMARKTAYGHPDGIISVRETSL